MAENLQVELMKLKAQITGRGEVSRYLVRERYEKVAKTIEGLPRGPVRLPGRKYWNHQFCYWWGLHEETAAAQVACRAEAEAAEIGLYEVSGE